MVNIFLSPFIYSLPAKNPFLHNTGINLPDIFRLFVRKSFLFPLHCVPLQEKCHFIVTILLHFCIHCFWMLNRHFAHGTECLYYLSLKIFPVYSQRKTPQTREIFWIEFIVQFWHRLVCLYVPEKWRCYDEIKFYVIGDTLLGGTFCLMCTSWEKYSFLWKQRVQSLAVPK